MATTTPSVLDEAVLVVDRGKPIILTALFDGEPEEVYVAYIRPGEERPRVDDGFGQPDSGIVRLDPRTYRYVIDTDGFAPGLGWWRFWGTGNGLNGGKDSKIGRFLINAAPAQLL